MEAVEAEVGRQLDAGDLSSATAAILRGYGPAILTYLAALARDEDRANDAFSQFCEDLWRGLPSFRRDASARTWAYKLAWHAWLRNERDAFRRLGRPLASEEMARIVAEVRSTTALHFRSEAKDAVARLRLQLTPAEQSLLVLTSVDVRFADTGLCRPSPEEAGWNAREKHRGGLAPWWSWSPR